jgi:hypothetical protein
MNTPFTLDTLGLLLLTVFPGAVSLQIYRLVFPARPLDWKDIIPQALFYSVINYGLLSFLLPFALNAQNQEANPALYWFAILTLLVVGPVAWPLLLLKLLQVKWIAARLQLPFPTTWDYFFRRRLHCFVLVHLKNGKLIGGYWGGDSYATSFPNDGAIYLQAVYRLRADRTFGAPIEGTMGALINKDQYDLIELLAVPPRPQAVRDEGEQRVGRVRDRWLPGSE